MKLSSKTGLKRMDAEINPLTYVEFCDNEAIVRLGSRFIDIRDEQYTIPKFTQGYKHHQEVNRFDGHKIFVGKNSLEEIALEEKEVLAKPVIIKSTHPNGLVTTWSIDEFDEGFHSNQNQNFQNDEWQEPAAGKKQSGNEISILDAKSLSRDMIENAKQEAQSILEAAEIEAKGLKDSAIREGYQSGFAQVNTEIETLRTIQKNLQHVHEDLIRGSENKIVDLIKLVTEKLFSSGLALDPNILKDVVARAINEASRLGNLKVYLNPDDLDKLKKLWRESELDYNGQKIQLASNNEVMPGGCFIDGDYGSVDARINTQVKSVTDTLTEIQLDQIED